MQPTQEQIDFVRKYWWYAVRAANKYAHNPTYILAHAVAERGFKGSSLSAPPYNNFYGILAMGNTTDYWHGESVKMGKLGLTFRVYRSLQDSFYDNALLLTNKKYASVIKNGTPEQFAHTIAYSPYISETNGDNRAVYKANILNAIDIINKVSKPLAYGTKLVIFSALMIGAVVILDYNKVINVKQIGTKIKNLV